MAKRVSVTRGFISDINDILKCFGAVRYTSFLRYLELCLDITPDAAVKIAEKLLARQNIVKANYSATPIVKRDERATANYDRLDAFEAYLFILDEEKKKDPRNDVTAFRTDIPTDFLFYTATGIMYDVIINNDKGAQKVRLLDRTDKRKHKNQILLFVYPSGADITGLTPPVLPGRHRLAVVRRQASGKATCVAGEVTGENSK